LVGAYYHFGANLYMARALVMEARRTTGLAACHHGPGQYGGASALLSISTDTSATEQHYMNTANSTENFILTIYGERHVVSDLG